MAQTEFTPNRWTNLLSIRRWTKGRFSKLAYAVVVVGACIAIKCIEPDSSTSAQQTASRQRSSQRAKGMQVGPQRAKPSTARVQNNKTGNSTSSLNDVDVATDIVAVVNGQRITRSHLARECIRRFGEDVLESEVNKRLILAACAENGITITAQDVEREVDRMATKFSVPKDQWLAMLEDESGISPTQYRRDVVWPTLALKRIAAESLEVSAADLEQAYDAEYGPMVQVRMIMSSTKAKAEKLHAAIVAKPERFEQLAKEHSEDVNSAAARGLIPPVRRHVGEPVLEKAAFGLKPGQVSPVISVANQFVILKCDRHIAARELGAKQKESIKLQLKDRIAEQKLRVEGKKIFGRLQSEARVVNVYNDPVKRKQMPGVAATINGKPVTLAQLGEQCILRHGNAVLDAEINRMLLEQSLSRRSLQVQKSDLNAEIVRAAESFGYFTPDGKSDVDRWLKHITEQTGKSVDLYVRDAVWPSAALKKLARTGSDNVTQDDLQKAFLANYGERVEVQAVVVSDQRTAHEVFDLARRNPTEKFFGELAHQYSVEPVSKANFGQVPPIRMHGGQPALEKEAFILQPGQISGVVAIGDAFVVMRCLGRTEPVVEDAKVVESELRLDIAEKKQRIAMTKEFDRLKEAAQVDNFLAKTVQPGKPSSPDTGVQQASFTDKSTAPSSRRK